MQANDYDNRCCFYCPHPSHKFFQSTLLCQSSDGHTTSVKYSDHNFDHKHPDLEYDAIQILFICDCTGSMETYMNECKTSIKLLIDSIFKNTAYTTKVSFIGYRDHGSTGNWSEVTKYVDFSDGATVTKFIDGLNCEGGGDTAEAIFDGISAYQKLSWSKSSKKIIILVADSPPHGEEFGCSSDEYPKGCPCGIDYKALLSKLESIGMDFYIVKASNGLDKMVKIFSKFLPKIHVIDLKKVSEMSLELEGKVCKSINKKIYQLDKKIVWHDPNIYSPSNKHYYEEYFKKMNIIRFDSHKTASEFIQSTDNSKNKYVIITSGTNGKELVEKIHDQTNVLGVVIFCMNKGYHEKWAAKFKKIHSLITSGFDEVAEEILSIYNSHCAFVMIEIGKRNPALKSLYKIFNDFFHTGPSLLLTGSSNGPESYVETETNIAKEFRQVLFFYMGFNAKCDYNASISKISAELVNLNLECEFSIRNNFELRKEQILKAIVYLYSTNDIYTEFNKTLAYKKYDQLLNTLCMIIHELDSSNKAYKDLFMKPGEIIYRGIKTSSQFATVQLYQKYQKNHTTIFFPGLTSTSLKKEISAKEIFSNGIIFKMQLNKTNPYPHIKIPKDWTMFPNEAEVLLFCYCPFIVESFAEEIIEKKKYTIISLIQDDTQTVISYNEKEFKAYWKKIIYEDLKPSVEEYRKKFREDILNTLKETKLYTMEFVKVMMEFYSSIQLEAYEVSNLNLVQGKMEKYLENNEGPENYFEMSLKILENMKEIVQNKFKTMGNQIQLFIQDCEIDDFFQFDKFVNLADEFDQDEHKKNVMNDLQNMPNLDGFSEEELHQFLLDRLNGENKMPLINYMMKKVDPRIESLKEFLLETTFKALIEKCK